MFDIVNVLEMNRTKLQFLKVQNLN